MADEPNDQTRKLSDAKAAAEDPTGFLRSRMATRETRLMAAALEVVCWPTERNLRTAPDGTQVGIPVTYLRELAERFEEAFPGMVPEFRRTIEARKAASMRPRP